MKTAHPNPHLPLTVFNPYCAMKQSKERNSDPTTLGFLLGALAPLRELFRMRFCAKPLLYIAMEMAIMELVCRRRTHPAGRIVARFS